MNITGPTTASDAAPRASGLNKSISRTRSFGLTDIGLKRELNEDAFVVDPVENIFVVADGVGGGGHGEVASRITVGTVVAALLADDSSPRPRATRLERAVAEAHHQIKEKIRNDPTCHHMGTTVVSLLVDDDHATVAHVGDSRAYLLREGHLDLLTQDHTVAADFVAAGRWRAEAAADHPMAHVLTRALNRQDEVEVDSALIPIQSGDIFLLCTDGLTGMLCDAEIRHGLLHGRDAEERSRRLVSEALERGGYDNVTVVVVEIV